MYMSMSACLLVLSFTIVHKWVRIVDRNSLFWDFNLSVMFSTILRMSNVQNVNLTQYVLYCGRKFVVLQNQLHGFSVVWAMADCVARILVQKLILRYPLKQYEFICTTVSPFFTFSEVSTSDNFCWRQKFDARTLRRWIRYPLACCFKFVL